MPVGASRNPDRARVAPAGVPWSADKREWDLSTLPTGKVDKWVIFAFIER